VSCSLLLLFFFFVDFFLLLLYFHNTKPCSRTPSNTTTADHPREHTPRDSDRSGMRPPLLEGRGSEVMVRRHPPGTLWSPPAPKPSLWLHYGMHLCLNKKCKKVEKVWTRLYCYRTLHLSYSISTYFCEEEQMNTSCFYPKRFTVLPHIHPFLHRRRCRPCKVTTDTSGAGRVRWRLNT